MADLYFHVWVTVTSLTIIILVAAYIIYDRIALSYQSLEETEKAARMRRLNSITMIILGGLAFTGSAYWIFFVPLRSNATSIRLTRIFTVLDRGKVSSVRGILLRIVIYM